MANDFDLTARNVMIDALGVVGVRLALHSADPGGANSATGELTGGSPAYARKTITWSAAVAGTADSPTDPVFDVPAGATVAWMSLWNSGNTVRYWKRQVTTEVFGAQGTYTVTDLDQDLNDP